MTHIFKTVQSVYVSACITTHSRHFNSNLTLSDNKLKSKFRQQLQFNSFGMKVEAASGKSEITHV